MGQRPVDEWEDIDISDDGWEDVDDPFKFTSRSNKPQDEKSMLQKYDEMWFNQPLTTLPTRAIDKVAEPMMQWGENNAQGWLGTGALYGGAFLHNIGEGISALTSPLNALTFGAGAGANAVVKAAPKVAKALNTTEKVLSAPQIVSGGARIHRGLEGGEDLQGTDWTDVGTGLVEGVGGMFGIRSRLPELGERVSTPKTQAAPPLSSQESLFKDPIQLGLPNIEEPLPFVKPHNVKAGGQPQLPFGEGSIYPAPTRGAGGKFAPKTAAKETKAETVELRRPSALEIERLKQQGYVPGGVSKDGFPQMVLRETPVTPVAETNVMPSAPEDILTFHESDTITVPKEKATASFISRLKDQGIELIGTDKDGNGLFKRLLNEDEGSLDLTRIRQLFESNDPNKFIEISENTPRTRNIGEEMGRVAKFRQPGRPLDEILKELEESLKEVERTEPHVKRILNEIEEAKNNNIDPETVAGNLKQIQEEVDLGDDPQYQAFIDELSKREIPLEERNPSLWKRLIGEEEGSLDLGPLTKRTPEEPSVLREAYNFPRGVTTTADISAPLRQGLPLIHRKEWWSSWVPMMKALGDEGAFKQTLDELKKREIFQSRIDLNTGKVIKSFAEQAGLKLSEVGGKLKGREEALVSNWVENGKFLGGDNALQRGYQNTLGRGARASNRAYTAYLNQLRADTFENLIKDAKRIYDADMKSGNKTPGKNPYTDLTFAKEIADFVNTATGRGPLKTALPNYSAEKGLHLKERGFEQQGKILTDIIFSPRLLASRVRMLNPLTYTMASPYVRKEYMKSLLATAGAWGTVTALASMAGASVNTDTNSADFGKIRIGNTRLDPAAGFQQYLVLASRLATGHTTSSATGRDLELGQGFNAPTRGETIQRFGANKLHPVLKFAHDIAYATEYQPFHSMDRAAQMMVPLVMQDVIELVKEDPSLLPTLVPVVAGMGTQTYDKGQGGGKLIPSNMDWIFQGGELPGYSYLEEQ